jgi:hypothetical protein
MTGIMLIKWVKRTSSVEELLFQNVAAHMIEAVALPYQ